MDWLRLIWDPYELLHEIWQQKTTLLGLPHVKTLLAKKKQKSLTYALNYPSRGVICEFMPVLYASVQSTNMGLLFGGDNISRVYLHSVLHRRKWFEVMKIVINRKPIRDFLPKSYLQLSKIENGLKTRRGLLSASLHIFRATNFKPRAVTKLDSLQLWTHSNFVYLPWLNIKTVSFFSFFEEIAQ